MRKRYLHGGRLRNALLISSIVMFRFNPRFGWHLLFLSSKQVSEDFSQHPQDLSYRRYSKHHKCLSSNSDQILKQSGDARIHRLISIAAADPSFANGSPNSAADSSFSK
ncbi:hypothetical protein AVEN_102991-1 [Araneus ventricosus]|uniref:Uncharacterized protein n=1 Tax=Araneus ventricosus TaxID=182803 RepID=A0A4Y2B8G7_ARAVE|nr:hypothetical protein AVEN_102991-1 [Araneus ventricosus]